MAELRREMEEFERRQKAAKEATDSLTAEDDGAAYSRPAGAPAPPPVSFESRYGLPEAPPPPSAFDDAAGSASAAPPTRKAKKPSEEPYEHHDADNYEAFARAAPEDPAWRTPYDDHDHHYRSGDGE